MHVWKNREYNSQGQEYISEIRFNANNETELNVLLLYYELGEANENITIIEHNKPNGFDQGSGFDSDFISFVDGLGIDRKCLLEKLGWFE